MMKQQPTRLMVELDTILDTRLGVVNQHLPHLVEPLLTAGYRDRKSDQLELLCPDIKQHWFNVAYAARDKDTLKASRITPLVIAHTNLTSELERLFYDTPLGSSVDIDLNIYPYVLSDAELSMVKDCLKHYSALTANVEIISQPMSYFTPSILKQHYGGIIVYNVAEWLSLHAEALLQCKIPDVSIIGPRRYAVEDDVPVDDDLSFLPEGVPRDIFAFTEEGLLEFVGLFYWDMRVFSFIDLAVLDQDSI